MISFTYLSCGLTTLIKGAPILNKSVQRSIVIRPFSTKRGLSILMYCSLIGLFFAAMTLFVSIIAPAGDAQAGSLITILGIVSSVTVVTGAVFFFVFPRVKIVFDSSRKEAVIVKAGSSTSTRTAVSFSSLQPFHIYELVPGHAHQFFCSNASFGEFSDLFFSAYHSRTLKKALKLTALTGASLIDCDGKVIT
jgi:hypothetical protein